MYGTLTDYVTYSSYLVKVLSLYRERGIHFYGISLQNEPLNAHAVYPAMYLSSADAIRLTKLVGPKLRVHSSPSPSQHPTFASISQRTHNTGQRLYPCEVNGVRS